MEKKRYNGLNKNFLKKGAAKEGRKGRKKKKKENENFLCASVYKIKC